MVHSVPLALAFLAGGVAADVTVATPGATAAAELPRLPEIIYVSGAGDAVAVVNGEYSLSEQEEHNGRPCYKKDRMKLWLCNDVHNLWSFQPQGSLGSAQGLMVSTEKRAASPVGAGPWRVWKDNLWAATSTVVRDGAQPQVAHRAYREVSLSTMMDRTLAGLLLGFILVGVLAVAMGSGSDEHIRAYTYRMFSSLFTFLIALLFSEAVWDALMKHFLPAPSPRGFGISPSLDVKVLVGFILLVLCSVLLNVISWKVQYRRARLMTIKTLGGNVTAMFAVIVFTHIQQAAVFQASFQFEGSIFHQDVIRALACFLAVVLGFVALGIFRAASSAARREWFLVAPTYPWGEPLAYDRVTERGCFGSSPSTDRRRSPSGPPWGEFVDEAEDEAAIVVTGFLLSQCLMFCRTGQLPGIKEHYSHDGNDRALLFFGTAILCLALLFLVILAFRVNRGGGGRPGKICQRSVAMATTWMCYRASCWNTRVYFVDNRPLALAIAAIGITAGCLVAIFLIDKFLDVALNRSASPVAHLSSRFGSDVPLSEKCMRAVNSCFGLVMAIAWQLNFESAAETVVQSDPFLADHAVLSRSAICIVLALVLALPWRRVILPLSEMKEAAIAESITFEQSHLEKAEKFLG